MKNARPSEAESSAPGQGVQMIAPGDVPARTSTVTSEVLARLLSHEHLISLEAVHGASTTRLAAVTFYLPEKYSWPIDSIEKAAGCKDRRVAWVSEYFLPPEVVGRALDGGAAEWCNKVRAVRLARRTKAAEAQRTAERFNATLKKRRHLGQWDLLEGGKHG